ncbi:Cyclic pyranopterin monophosphate synthase [Maioricimonas rarisocia]|uniref:Cyclic pyranopterin monophosphate synthase n=1 Tax=Maioricimonas rarisocia TaxID=2528026 RepID=A0A517ZDS5_9PLAN|nr:radical SAM/SPASM domain-containing protein [Maioricimonas rarisocia]QDU40633.1 Cyclic pyranopterin monophosphate synthase [Maioricimonas rarisocia]
MYLRLAKRFLVETDKRALWKLGWNMGVKGSLSVLKFRRRLKRGDVFPPFLYISIINSCNLRCQGCWVDVSAKQQVIDLEAMNRLIDEAKSMGNSFFGIVGGEPFMHPNILEIFRQHPDCYFQVFTNGHFITDDVAKELRRMGNVTPLISVEGSEIVSDERRGRKDVLSKTMQGIQNCLNNKVFTGVCTSVCKTNIDDLVNEKWVDRLVEMGVFYTWFHVYRPMGPEASPELALSREDQNRLRQFVVDMRASKPIIIVDAYYDQAGEALCPAATGITHHINPWGGVEPCPIVQFVTDSIHDESKSLHAKFNSPFLQDFRELARDTTRGCIVLERPDLLKDLVEKHSAEDGTARQTALSELKGMQVRPSQYNPEDAIPEKSWAYRIGKRLFFNSFGVYDGRDHSQASAPALIGRGEVPTTSAEPDVVELQV